jgi:hypothetical protein
MVFYTLGILSAREVLQKITGLFGFLKIISEGYPSPIFSPGPPLRVKIDLYPAFILSLHDGGKPIPRKDC